MDILPLAHPHDHLARHFLSNVDLAADFLRNYVAREVMDKLDLDRLRCESPVKVDSELVERIGDLRFSTGFKEGGPGSEIFIFFEHQSSQDRFIPFRIFDYIAASYREIRRAAGAAAKSGEIFPYPLAVVLYHGQSPWSGPLKMHELIKKHPGLPGEILDFPVYLVDLAKIPAEKIRGAPPVRALLSALRAASDRELGKRLAAILRTAAEEREEFRRKNWVRALLRYFICLEKPPGGMKGMVGMLADIFGGKEAEEMTTSLAEELIRQGEARGEARGEAKGEARGEAKGEAKAILMVLGARFGFVPADIREAVESRSDPLALEPLTVHAATCKNIMEFRVGLRQGFVQK
ncbi:MAG: Rpn family recombination-promoting nuclease/putative transposase [Planctomycetota bacterium]|jgi:hypothetical protein|nr:Rpn family recombination-promoting nuclease/putative transposase [Planctomycetota bacterium]